MTSFFTDIFAKDIWKTKYAGSYSDFRTYVRDMVQRIVPSSENRKQFETLLLSKKFSPGGRILAHAGRARSKMSLMNCTTYKIKDDSLEAIADAALFVMRASSRGQGVGIDLSNLRPRGAPVDNAAKTSTGAVSFMEMLDSVGGVVGQEGRRAALLFSLHIGHPDIWREDGYDFLRVKSEAGRVENANISVRVTDDFMHAALLDQEWALEFVGVSGGDAFSQRQTVRARDLFRALAESAWKSGEPGILFWSTSRRLSNTEIWPSFQIVNVNACSEQVLDQEGVCNLGSLNLAAFVRDPFTLGARFDFVAFREAVRLAVRFLDYVIDVELGRRGYVSSMQGSSLALLRRIGLGVMGYADMLAMLGIPYTYYHASSITKQVFSVLRDTAYLESVRLVEERGPAPVFNDVNINTLVDYCSSGFIATLPEEIRNKIFSTGGLRNVTLLSIAPTGSIAAMLGVSSGVEPVFALEYERKHRIHGSWETVRYRHPAFRDFPDATRWRTAYEVSPQDHVEIAALVQQYVDQSVSKTVNLPADATVQDVEDIFTLAWGLGMKGVTVYRDGSRDQQVLTAAPQDDDAVCPVCDSVLLHSEGCVNCLSCSYGKCSV